MMNIDPKSFFASRKTVPGGRLNGVNLNLGIETPDMIIGAVFANTAESPDDTVVAKVFIYKYTTPNFIEVNFDETYINYLFDDPALASSQIADYTLKMLTIDFPSSILSMTSSSDIGLVQLPQGINR